MIVRVPATNRFLAVISAAFWGFFLFIGCAPPEAHVEPHDPGTGGPDQLCRVTHVVDGDTLDVRINGREERVRLLGVDTPEMGHRDRSAEFFAEQATKFTRRMAEGKTAVLVGDPGHEDRDRYGRLLRYVRLEDGTLLNAEIIRRGYGFAYTRFPFARMEEFRRYEREARLDGKGLWAEDADDPPVIHWQDAGGYIGRKAIVEGTVVATMNTGGACFLNFHTDWKYSFTIVILARDLTGFPVPPEDLYRGRTVRVRGRIKRDRDRPEIVVRDPADLWLID